MALMNVARPDLRKDVKYRRFVQAVDKILQSFDSVNEWADVIGFLTRLGKVSLTISWAERGSFVYKQMLDFPSPPTILYSSSKTDRIKEAGAMPKPCSSGWRTSEDFGCLRPDP